MTDPNAHDRAFTEAQILQWQFKTPAMRKLTCAVCRLALARGPGGEFSANDLPLHGELEQGGSGIAGSVFRQLINAGIIAVAGRYDADGTFYPKIVLNHCKNKIGVYTLRSPALCRALLRVHDPSPAPVVEQMIFALPARSAA